MDISAIEVITELFLGGYLDGCKKGGYDCVCIKPAEAAA